MIFTTAEALDKGREYAVQGEHRDAIGLFRGVLVHEPENFEAMLRLGSSLFEMKDYYEALYWFWRARKINRRHPLALTNYGLCLSQVGHPEEGVADLERAAAIVTKENAPLAIRALVYNNLGNTLERLCRHVDALAAFDKGIAADPHDAFPHYNRGIALLRLNRRHEAIAALNRSLELSGRVDASASRLNNADALYNRAMALLLLGDFKNGFRDYEARLHTSEHKREISLPAEKEWKGETWGDKPLFVCAEQGVGDTIQFLRFLPALRERGPVMLAVQTALQPLVKDTWPDLPLLPARAQIPNDSYSHWVHLMSLPYRLGVETEADIPAPWVPTISPEPLGFTIGLPMNVGVCWAGNFLHKNDDHRSIPLHTFGRLFDAPCNFVSLQQMRQGEEGEFVALKAQHRNLLGLYFDDWRGTAAALLNLDLVITADTAVAHLAATLGLPTWILVPAYSTDWRWQLERIDSPWYPSVRLFRQTKVGDWSQTLDAVRKVLIDETGSSRNNASASGGIISVRRSDGGPDLAA
jgi:tetratricopeptide (TPR) repeat protein